jgi:hypothetical protein
VGLRHTRGGLRNPTARGRASASSDTHVGEEQRSYLTLTTSSYSQLPMHSLWLSVSASTASSPVSAFSATPPRVSGSRHNTATTWASTSTQQYSTSSHQQQTFGSWPSKPGNYCNVLHGPADGSMSRNSSHSQVRRSTFFSLSRLQDFSCATCTPYSAANGEAESASPLSSVATYNGGPRCPTAQMARTSTARSSQPTYTATFRGMVEEQY